MAFAAQQITSLGAATALQFHAERQRRGASEFCVKRVEYVTISYSGHAVLCGLIWFATARRLGLVCWMGCFICRRRHLRYIHIHGTLQLPDHQRRCARICLSWWRSAFVDSGRSLVV